MPQMLSCKTQASFAKFERRSRNVASGRNRNPPTTERINLKLILHEWFDFSFDRFLMEKEAIEKIYATL